MLTYREALPSDLPAARDMMIRVLERDFRARINPDYHWDIADLKGTYLDALHQRLFVAVDQETGRVAGITAIRADGPKSPPHPAWIGQKYNAERCCHLLRVWVDEDFRRRGIARNLVMMARDWVKKTPFYNVVYLHTDASVPGAERFWRSMPVIEVLTVPASGGHGETIHFELDLADPE